METSGFVYAPERPKEDTFVGQKWGWTAKKAGEGGLGAQRLGCLAVRRAAGVSVRQLHARLDAGSVRLPSSEPFILSTHPPSSTPRLRGRAAV